MSENPLDMEFYCTYCERGGLVGHQACRPGPQPYIPLRLVPQEVIERLRAEHLMVNTEDGPKHVDPDAAAETAKLERPNPAPPPDVETCDECGDILSAGYCASCAARGEPLPPELRQQEGWGDI